MSTHNISFHEEIRKLSELFVGKGVLSGAVNLEPMFRGDIRKCSCKFAGFIRYPSMFNTAKLQILDMSYCKFFEGNIIFQFPRQWQKWNSSYNGSVSGSPI